MIRTIVFIIFWFASLVGCAQTTDLLYIFPSKEVYETGEDMWFKAYLMDRQTFALSDRSQTLYLQLRSEKGDVVWSEKYLLTAGRGDGHVYIGDKWQQGEYLMEGYARSSFTTDSTLAIHPRRIRVVDRVSQMDSISSEAVKQDSIEKITAKHRFDLFPEGGDPCGEFIKVFADVARATVCTTEWEPLPLHPIGTKNIKCCYQTEGLIPYPTYNYQAWHCVY